ncbi:hypothetical protein K461DRAFT_292106 [Myriangium duriaei CBS 260.36]|uniref:DASH complex subunit DAM1 n=1 Tax=Myriangium duriaei CBS 260.36 TaxID=1168546 RepID=A0A9P4J4F2_9PEZI|nr:hypothetical protein K461DRAFT_292106 [Myriangium duriaei CBS 260.36]
MSTADSVPRQRSTSRTRRPPTRPTTPLRAPSRTSLRASSTTTPQSTQHNGSHPLDALEPAFGEFSDAIADLESNMMHLALLHESVSRFNDDFAAFLYGLNMSAFCVDFPEAPGPDAVRRFAERQASTAAANNANAGTPRRAGMGRDRDVDATFLTTDTSFVNDPPASVRATNEDGKHTGRNEGKRRDTDERKHRSRKRLG